MFRVNAKYMLVVLISVDSLNDCCMRVFMSRYQRNVLRKLITHLRAISGD